MALFRTEPELWVVVASAVVVGAVTGWLQSVDLRSFYTLNGDLGTYNQSLYTTVHNGMFFYYTVNYPSGAGTSIFAAHFSPILLLVLPVYALAPGPLLLVFVKQAAIVAGAIPLYKLADLKLGSRRWALLISLAYLLSPIILLTDVANFDPEVFLPVLVLSSFYFAEKGRTVPFLVFWLLALSTLESAALMLILFSLVWWIGLVWANPQAHGWRRGAWTSLPAIATYSAVAWIGLSVGALFLAGSRGGAFGPGYASLFTVLGASSVLSVPGRVILDPGAAVAALSYDGGTKVAYLLLLLGSVGFIALAGRLRYLVPVAFWIGFVSLASATKLYHFGLEYQAYPAPFLFAGLVTGLAALGVGRRSPSLGPEQEGAAVPSSTATAPSTSSSSPVGRAAVEPTRRRSRAWIPVVLAVIVVGAVVTTNLLPGNSAPSLGSPSYAVIYAPHWPSAHAADLNQVIATIPSSASVLTTSKLFTYVSSRPGAFTIKYGNLFAPPWTYQTLIDHYLNASGFVLIDFVYDPLDGLVYGLTGNLSAYGIRAAADGAYLYERDWLGPPTLFVPDNQSFSADAMSPITGVFDSTVVSPYGPSIYHAAGGKARDVVWSGPNMETLPTGRYQATFWLYLNAPNPGAQLELTASETPMAANMTLTQSSSQGVRYSEGVRPLSSESITVASTNLTRGVNQSAAQSGNFTLDFNWPGFGYLNLKGIELSTTMSLYFYAVTITQLAA